MIIYQKGFLTLDYNPSTDILKVDLPNVVELGMPELERSLEIIAENIVNYDIKKLLLDSSNVRVEQITDEAYKTIVEHFFSKLVKTRLQKIARVNSAMPVHEARVIHVTSGALVKFRSSILFETFTSKTQALNWLLY